MGLLFLFLIISGGFDLFRLFIRWPGIKNPRKIAELRTSPQRLFVAQAVMTLVIYGYGLLEAADIRLEQIEIISPKISQKTGKIRIAQISDVHLGLIVRQERLSRIISKIKEADPDILVSTGDLLDGQLNHLTKEASLLALVKPPLGKFAITGNHEFYAGLHEALEFTEAAGFTILRNKGVETGGINIVGVDDPAGKYFDRYPAKPESDILSAQPKENFTILLKHRPEVDPESLRLFDLQLSGHTHKGQIFPFNLLTWFFYPCKAGRLNILDNGFLYPSRGTGTWGPPIRFLAPPEVTIIDLIPATQ